jgi:threonine dehydrogenase-like Zn-dependent dehydrogenase
MATKIMNIATNKADDKVGKKRVLEGSTIPERSTTENMKALTWEGKKKVKVSMVGKPLITHPDDVIVKVTACCICSGSDSHMFGNDIPGIDPGFTLGHECCGIIDQMGENVTKFKTGDRVVVAFEIACGQCAYCHREEYSGCDTTNDSKLMEETFGHAHGAVFGYGRLLGSVPGSQAEFVRVPFGEVNCYPIPSDVPDEKALYISDVLSTSLHAVDMGEVKEGQTVVIWGLGPIGLNACKWARVKGATRVIGIDMVPERLALAQSSFGATEVVDRSHLKSQEVVDRLFELLPEGADVVIEAVGFRFPITKLHTVERALGLETDTADILLECMRVVRKYGIVSIIGDYAGFANHFPIGFIMMKHLTVRSGQTPVQKYFKYVMDCLQKGIVDPTPMITHRIDIEEAPLAYEKLYDQKDGWIKTFITFDGKAPEKK